MILCMVVCAAVMFVVSAVGALIIPMGDETWKISAVAAPYFTGNLQTAAGTAASLELKSETMALFSAASVIPWVVYSLGAYLRNSLRRKSSR